MINLRAVFASKYTVHFPSDFIMKSILGFLCLLLLVPAASGLAADKKNQVMPVPDFTRGDTLPKKAPHDWTLGATGARGWIYSANGHSKKARQILVTAVDEGSPADGTLRVGDVILGVDGEKFDDDARILFAKALTVAETRKGKGRLRVQVWRDGKTKKMTLKLPVLGTYSSTAPYDCEKSQRIFELGCEALAERMNRPNYPRGLNPIPRALNALALLASGEKRYLPLLKREARWAANMKVDQFATWYYGYNMIFLAEYINATGDRSVMKGLERIALESVKGQSRVGTWGHKFARPDGNLDGYGCMNSPGLSLCTGMVLAYKVGVKKPELEEAIKKTTVFLRWYVNKGAVPYGDHLPFNGHEDNGKCSCAAVLFDLVGDREAAEFFAKMGTAAYDERERGHTGNFFNILWALPGVARCGPLAMGAYMEEQSWYYDLARRWDMNYVYQGSPDGAQDHGKHKGWDSTGAYLLGYAFSLKSLIITGKEPFSVRPLKADQVAEVIAAGRGYAPKGNASPYSQRSVNELLAGLSSWSPAVRERSAKALGKKQGDFGPKLLKMLDSRDQNARYGAVQALGALGGRAEVAGPQLRAALRVNDPWLQGLAAEAIPKLGPKVGQESVSDLLRLTLSENPSDPRRLIARSAAAALFAPYPGARGPRSILGKSLEGVDRRELLPAIKMLLQHDDAVARRSVGYIYNKLTDADLVMLLPTIVKATEELAPSNEMFADNIRLAGLDLLSRLHIKEGLPLCVSVIEPTRWGQGRRLKKCIECLGRYGTHVESVYPELQKVRQYYASKQKVSQEVMKLFDDLAAEVKSAKTPTLVSVSEFEAKSRRRR